MSLRKVWSILFAVLVSGMSLVQILFMVISYINHSTICESSAEYCERFPTGIRILYRVLTSIIPFSCIMPSFLLANFVRYQEKEHTDTRLFQDKRYEHTRISKRPSLMAYVDAPLIVDNPNEDVEKVELVSTILCSHFQSPKPTILF